MGAFHAPSFILVRHSRNSNRANFCERKCRWRTLVVLIAEPRTIGEPQSSPPPSPGERSSVDILTQSLSSIWVAHTPTIGGLNPHMTEPSHRLVMER